MDINSDKTMISDTFHKSQNHLVRAICTGLPDLLIEQKICSNESEIRPKKRPSYGHFLDLLNDF